MSGPDPSEVDPTTDELRVALLQADLDVTAAELARLRRRIAEHRIAIENAGTVRVDSRDELQAEAKHQADQRLWAVLDGER